MSGPNQSSFAVANITFPGSRWSEIKWCTCLPENSGPSSFQVFRRKSLRKINAPLRVPTSTVTSCTFAFDRAFDLDLDFDLIVAFATNHLTFICRHARQKVSRFLPLANRPLRNVASCHLLPSTLLPPNIHYAPRLP